MGQKYSDGLKRHVASLVREYGVGGATLRLNANAGSALASQRNAKLVPSRLNISTATASKYAKERGVPVRGRGRPALV